jgi:hypothetical protein
LRPRLLGLGCAGARVRDEKREIREKNPSSKPLISLISLFSH